MTQMGCPGFAPRFRGGPSQSGPFARQTSPCGTVRSFRRGAESKIRCRSPVLLAAAGTKPETPGLELLVGQRIAGIEPATSGFQAGALPLSYIQMDAEGSDGRRHTVPHRGRTSEAFRTSAIGDHRSFPPAQRAYPTQLWWSSKKLLMSGRFGLQSGSRKSRCKL